MSEPWDPAKARANLRKHGVSFNEARTVWRDEEKLVTEDRDHSRTETRYTVLGFSARGRLPRVTCTLGDDTMRPISARRATKRERHEYRFGPR